MISIDANKDKIYRFLKEVLINHRKFYTDWSLITKQTAAIKSGYFSQHLASLITGVEGTFTGARGDDLKDGTEVKACSRIDALDKCNDCGIKLPRYLNFCPNCNSSSISRSNDSKWLFSIRDENDLHTLLNTPRILLIFIHYPLFKHNDFNTIDIESFEIYPQKDKHIKFKELINDYYYNNVIPKQEARKKVAPKNFWPESFQFYISNPIKTLHCRIQNNSIDILKYIEPLENRDNLSAIDMPTNLLKENEKDLISLDNTIEYIDEKTRLLLPLREANSFEIATPHHRPSSQNSQ